MEQISFWIASPAEARNLGARLGSMLEGDETIALVGDRGVARAHFVEGLAEGLDVTELTPGPMQEYEGRAPLVLIDVDQFDEAELRRSDSTFNVDLLDHFLAGSVVVLQSFERYPVTTTPDITIRIDADASRHRFVIEAAEDVHASMAARAEA